MVIAPARPRLAFVSHVRPFPSSGGQTQRVRNLLQALRAEFSVSFLGVVQPQDRADVEAELAHHVDDVRLLDARLGRPAVRALLGPVQTAYLHATGLKETNFQIGAVELSPTRVLELVGSTQYDIAVFQYWHSWRAAKAIRDGGVPTVLDMHNILWRSLEANTPPRASLLRQLLVPHPRLAAYRRREEAAWGDFSGILAINHGEADHVRGLYPSVPMIVAGMGIDLERWAYRWTPPKGPPTIAFYGGLSSERGVQDALVVHDRVMPMVWESVPDARLLVIGADPPEAIRRLGSERVEVTGFVADPAEHLTRAHVLVCPFVGRYGFRSRLVEALATGTPVVCTSDAVYGMDIGERDGLAIADTPEEMAARILEFVHGDQAAVHASMAGRAAVEDRFDLASTYERAARWTMEMARRGG